MATWTRVSLTALVFVTILLLCFPYYGLDSDPPHHFNVLNQEIANDHGGVAILLASISAAVVWFAAGHGKR